MAEYLAAQPKAARGVLQRVRRAIRRGMPEAEETMAYGLPTYKIRGRAVLYFAGWKHHYSLYPATDRVIAAFKDDLAPYEVDKRTIRFGLSEPVPLKLIEGVARLRAKERAGRRQPKAFI